MGAYCIGASVTKPSNNLHSHVIILKRILFALEIFAGRGKLDGRFGERERYSQAYQRSS